MGKPEHKTEQQMSRRTFMKALTGGGILLAAGGLWGAVGKGVFSTGKGPAYKGWANWRPEETGDDSLLKSFIYPSILASNAHNTQPWLVKVEENELNLYADLSRNIGTMDPFYREMYISLGCFLENLHITAAAHGYILDESLYNGAFNEVHVGNVTMKPGKGAHPELYEAIPLRHTNRGAYTDKKVNLETLNKLSALKIANHDPEVIWWHEKADKENIGKLIDMATETIVNDPDQARDSHRWYRQNWDELQIHRDGTTLDATGNSFLIRAFGKMIPVSEQTANQYWYRATKDIQIPTASAFGSITIQDASDRRQLIETGRLWQRMHLWGTANGLAMQPMNQPNERIDRERQLGLAEAVASDYRKLLGHTGKESVFTFRIGYPEAEALPSPRRDIADVLL